MSNAAHERITDALSNEVMRAAIRKGPGAKYAARPRAMAELDGAADEGLVLGTFDEMRERARVIKSHTLQHLDIYLGQAASAIRARGGHVHFAADGREANEIIGAIMKSAGAKLAVKSKSMATEEIHLNGALESAGVEVVETDLGEWIIQLAKEPPSHIVGPAMHKNRDEVAALFSKVAGRPLANDTPTLTAVAREQLRAKFMAADVGISGANCIVAETGTVTLVTNEGNGRLATSAPRVHIVVAGVEKLVPTLADLSVILALLPRSASAQKISTYVNMVTGPRRPREADGPEEFHLVFIDNGRTGALGTEFEEALYCLRCGACLNACPVYRNIGGHAYGHPISGPIGAVFVPLTQGLQDWQELPQMSSLCGACWEVCPVGIHLHDHLVRLRSKAIAEGRGSRLEAFTMRFLAWAWTRPVFYRLVQKVGWWMTGHDPERWVTRMPGPAAAWTDGRDFPAVAARPFRERWAQLEAEEGGC